MSHLAQLLTFDSVLLDLPCVDKSAVFDQISLLFEKKCGIARAFVKKNLLERESLASTGLGCGVAVPHGRVKGLKSPAAAFLRLKEAVPFDSPDGEPVHLLVVLLIPDNVTQKHLEVLSEVAEMFSNSAFRAMLSSEMEPQKVYDEIAAWAPGQC